MRKNLKLVNLDLSPIDIETNRKMAEIIKQENDLIITREKIEDGIDVEINVKVDLEKLQQNDETEELKHLIRQAIRRIEKYKEV